MKDPHDKPSAPKTRAVAVAPEAPSPSGRLAALTGAAVALAAIPIPVLPDRLVDRVRGAVAHDVTSRHGLSLTSGARTILAAPDRDRRAGALLRKSVELAAYQLFRRIGPLGFVAAASRGLEVFALGHLMERYLANVRKSTTVRLDADEAKKVREAIDRAVVRSISPALRPSALTLTVGVEDLRDEYTRWLDTLLLTAATLPSYVERRLESAFDEVWAELGEQGHG